MLGGFGASEFGNTNLFMATRMRITAVSDPAAIPIISPVVSEEECDVPGDVFVELLSEKIRLVVLFGYSRCLCLRCC